MSKHVIIIRWALQKLTRFSSRSVTNSRASKYSRESTSNVCWRSTAKVKETDVNWQELNHHTRIFVIINILQCLQIAQLFIEFALQIIIFIQYSIWLSFLRLETVQESTIDGNPKCANHLHSVVHFSGSSIRCCLVCSSSFFSQSYLARTSEILCCRCSKIFSLALKYTTSWGHNNS